MGLVLLFDYGIIRYRGIFKDSRDDRDGGKTPLSLCHRSLPSLMSLPSLKTGQIPFPFPSRAHGPYHAVSKATADYTAVGFIKGKWEGESSRIS